jgi:hypothetical protein
VSKLYVLLYDLFWRLPIREGSENRDYIYEKANIFLTEERMSIYSSVNILVG